MLKFTNSCLELKSSDNKVLVINHEFEIGVSCGVIVNIANMVIHFLTPSILGPI